MNRTSRQLVIAMAALSVVLMSAAALAEVTLPHILGSNMVLQREIPLKIWGWAAPGEEVTVSLAGQKRTTKADAAGTWQVKLSPLHAGDKPLEMTIVGANTLKLENILVGEVWVCSGQSNMQFSLGQTDDAEKDIAAADCPEIRLFTAPRAVTAQPASDVVADWEVCSPQTVKGFSAVGYFFGRDVQEKLHVPIGLISTNWGGTRIEPWTPGHAFGNLPALKDFAEQVAQSRQQQADGVLPLLPSIEAWVKAARQAQSTGEPLPPLPPLPSSNLYDNSRPTTLYNGMVAPLVNFGIRGAIWYQGESNLQDGMTYLDKMKALIAGWRAVWNQGDFPFYYVQLAPYRYGSDTSALPKLWEAQTAALSFPNTGMAVTNDISTVGDIHPKNKKDVGKRLAMWALAKTYVDTSIVYSGPLYKSMKVEGSTIRVSFDHTGSGLASRDAKPLTWFQVAAADGKFVDAKATIDGKTVVITSVDVKEPVAVQFAWSGEAEPNLMNKEGLPASAFRAGNVESSEQSK